jgi:hypothetical protein
VVDANAYRQARIKLVAAIGRLSELQASAAEGPASADMYAAAAAVRAASTAVRLLEAGMIREDQMKNSE